MKEKVIVSFYKDEAEKKYKRVEDTREAIQKVFDEFNKMIQKKEPLTFDEFQTMYIVDYSGPNYSRSIPNESVIRDLVVSRFVKGEEFGGLRVKKEMFDLPPLEGVFAAIRGLGRGVTSVDSGYYQLVDGAIKLRSGLKKEIEESFTVYAETDKEKKRFELAKRLAGVLNEIIEEMPKDKPWGVEGNEFKQGFDLIIRVDDSGKLIPADYYIENGRVWQ